MSEFNLTVSEVVAWFDYAEKANIPAGTASDPETCPLACAYRHAHWSGVSIGSDFAYMLNGSFRLQPWQREFVKRIDSNYDYDASVPVVGARELLKKVV